MSHVCQFSAETARCVTCSRPRITGVFARDLRAGQTILNKVGTRLDVTSNARKLGGSGRVSFGLAREGREPWSGLLDADTVVQVLA